MNYAFSQSPPFCGHMHSSIIPSVRPEEFGKHLPLRQDLIRHGCFPHSCASGTGPGWREEVFRTQGLSAAPWRRRTRASYPKMHSPVEQGRTHSQFLSRSFSRGAQKETQPPSRLGGKVSCRGPHPRRGFMELWRYLGPIFSVFCGGLFPLLIFPVYFMYACGCHAMAAAFQHHPAWTALARNRSALNVLSSPPSFSRSSFLLFSSFSFSPPSTQFPHTSS